MNAFLVLGLARCMALISLGLAVLMLLLDGRRSGIRIKPNKNRVSVPPEARSAVVHERPSDD